MLTTVTLTGADDTVNPSRLISLAQAFPFVEMGILIGTNYRERFPSLSWFADLERQLTKSGRQLSLSLHICGRVLDRIIQHGTLQIPYEVPLYLFQRAQLNFHGDKMPEGTSDNIRRAFFGVNIVPIIQLDGVNDHIMREIPGSQGLYDQSHGAGVLPAAWPTDGLTNVGFAGGLGSENVVAEIEKINAFHTAPYWIDMETKLRSSDDMFDIAECGKILELCEPYVK